MYAFFLYIIILLSISAHFDTKIARVNLVKVDNLVNLQTKTPNFWAKIPTVSRYSKCRFSCLQVA